MNKQKELFCKWTNLKEEIQGMAAIIQNALSNKVLKDLPQLDQYCITSLNLAEWKTQCIRFENKYFHLKQNTEKFITEYLTQSK